ncbi:hypothetical protein [Gilvimarinus sp. 1_MG-2023]|uniref:hypothetical protein n=1 Tax=Gilvimarinus sp. 1_MG-2023 TaxID=3062638 RepID=UPI0026E162D8|nr:hypothetical protein [Gilvimarinus sp. 1_MG-2023]MDO6747193.1 hypothetical protein [Gilvimarinus sp. 1_MG-2023]
MIYKGILQPREAVKPLSIAWNSETGEFTGVDAQRAQAFVDTVVEDGYVEVLPCLNHHFNGEMLTAEEVGTILNVMWFAGEVFPLLQPDNDIPEGVVS